MRKKYHFETHEIVCHTTTYVSRGQDVECFLVTPKRHKPHGLVICHRGGTGTFGRPDETIIFHMLIPFAKAGFATITSCLGEPDQHGGADVNDSRILVKEAVNTFPHLPLFFFGFSRGGTTNFQLLATKDCFKPKAVVASAACSNYASIAKERPDLKKLLRTLVGKWDKKEITKRSGVSLAGQFPKNIPFLLMHGTLDKRVQPHHSLDMQSVLKKNGNSVSYLSFKNCSHSFINTDRSSRWSEMLQLAITFFNKHVKP